MDHAWVTNDGDFMITDLEYIDDGVKYIWTLLSASTTDLVVAL